MSMINTHSTAMGPNSEAPLLIAPHLKITFLRAISVLSSLKDREIFLKSFKKSTD